MSGTSPNLPFRLMVMIAARTARRVSREMRRVGTPRRRAFGGDLPNRSCRAFLSWERQSIHGESYRSAVWSGYILIWRTEAAIHSMARWILSSKDKVPLTQGPLNRDPLAR